MTTNVPTRSRIPSRRALLAGALAGIGAALTGAVGRLGHVRAADGQAVVLGVANSALNVTDVTSTSSSNPAFRGTSPGTGVGLWGHSEAGTGVFGKGFGEAGVSGDGGAVAHGVTGHTAGEGKFGVIGRNDGDGSGMLGFAGLGSVPAAQPKTGVFGYAPQDESSVGVRGESIEGVGTLGLATGSGPSALGMFARSESAEAPALGARSAGNSTGIIAKSGGGSFPSPKAKTAILGYANQDGGSRGVWGNSPKGHGIHGQSSAGWAGYFDGRVLMTRYAEMVEVATPSAPDANHARLFIRDNGSGKTQLCVRFHTGSVRVLATQP